MTRRDRNQFRNGLIACLILAWTAMDAHAALSEKYREWRDGPVQWIMTSDEQKSWRGVKTDDQATHFIDLFWARRDPTPGTVANEFRAEFDGRVKWADENFIDRRTVGRKLDGSKTERGRVYIVLGNPSNNDLDGGRTSSQAGREGGGDPTGNRALGLRETWIWEGDDARKFDLPRIEVVFIEDPGTRRVQRDPTRPDFGRAAPNAIRNAIVNPELTEVPEWAARGGLEPVVPALTFAVVPPRIVEAPQEESPLPPAQEAPVEIEFDGPVEAAATSGASRLTLLAPGSSFVANSSSDPFAQLQSTTTFRSKDKVEWVAQYCSSTPKVPDVEVLVGISGPFGGSSPDRVTPPKKMKLTRLAASPGCYSVRGAAPLNKLPAGKYLIRVMFEDLDNAESYDLERQFVIQ